jgi:hypothetical protein
LRRPLMVAMEHGKRSAPARPMPPAKRPATAEDDLIEEQFDDDEYDAAAPPPADAEDIELGEAGRNWCRPPAAAVDPSKDGLGKAISNAAAAARPAKHACTALAAACTFSEVFQNS